MSRAIPEQPSATLRKLNPHLWPSHDNPDHSPSSPEPQPPVCHESVGPQAREEGHPGGILGRVTVRITSYRRRLIDPDNLCPKYFVDACRYSRLIRDDTAAEIEFSVRQEKVTSKEEERTVIEIHNPNGPATRLLADGAAEDA